ncbi:Asp-tRNA(Asn)/Glu-tRNA(Gln) amidotransferase subunit GatB [Denitrobaculum tricleocarpae]|uniref:Aspartyl/glutamyl-tRNA(Asn/Gln) amidotransferase subunit B n=1 Tax=Denitrobaculum tricleocarpae TaxID=2591009 RepID=A0A545TTT0_9PROT|nr:Asp-tRNA(Asn)/Glu-tRNA(Gln) amidotransferase subunit GatB [Denitrobaculum tricleocarpae]TQV80630.1 Asp-tRNA(Asn)/Glu-tRNA(Gln) amidotransferase subunit GatB [Denitrobaculum tricleocarpae]
MTIIEGKTGPWEMVIGLEVHAQVIANSKLFSGAATAFGAEPNSQVSLVDAAMPGMLPVINEMAVEQAVKTGLGLNAKINLFSEFERKNYFYADLPQGYQISQFLHPIVGEGTIILDLEDGKTREVGIERLHLEQDAGKSLHDQHPTMSYIDLNRSGVTLMEIVSKPDMRSAEEAGAYLRKLRSILRYLGTCDGNMDEGSMRADVNLSMRRPGEPFGTRTETKNVNSIRFVQQSIELEAKRQVAILEEGGTIDQETRLFDASKGTSRSMRSKEEAHDYRYFPDPDLLPLKIDGAWVESLKKELPELPDAKKQRFIDEFGLPVYDAGVLVADQETAAFYETVAKGRDPKLAANWVIGDYFGALNRTSGANLGNAPVDATKLGGLIDLIADGTISGRTAKEVFEAMWDSGKDAAAIVEEKGLKQISDTGALEGIVDQLIADNPGQVEQYQGGNAKLIGWFVGQVMKATQGKANPGMVNQLLKKKLG